MAWRAEQGPEQDMQARGFAAGSAGRPYREGGRFGRVLRTGITLVAYLAGVTLLLYLLAFVVFLVAS